MVALWIVMLFREVPLSDEGYRLPAIFAYEAMMLDGTLQDPCHLTRSDVNQ